MDWSHLAWELPSKTRYWRRGRGKDIVTGGRERRRKQLLDDLKDTRGCRKLKQEALDRTVWTRFGRGHGRVARQWIDEWVEEWMVDWITVQDLMRHSEYIVFEPLASSSSETSVSCFGLSRRALSYRICPSGCPRTRKPLRHVTTDVGFVCDETAVVGDTIKGMSVVPLCT